MEQKDYILREIEKISMIISATRQKFFGGNENLSFTVEKQIDDAKGMLLDEANFDLDIFLSMDIVESNEYVSGIKGFNLYNIELLAECIAQIGLNENSDDSKKYLEKALQLYEFCNVKGKTFSLERETNMRKIKELL